MAQRKRDTSKKRESILDAAAQAFQQEGYETTSMDRIAEIAGASKRTVYNHFESKEVLFQAVTDRLMQELKSLKQISYDPERSLEDQLGEFADAKLAVAREPNWLGLMKVGLGVFIRDPALAQRTMARAEGDGDTLVTWIEAAISDGRLSAKNPVLAANLFWSMVSGAFFFPAVFMGPMDPDEASSMKEELIRTFLARYRA